MRHNSKIALLAIAMTALTTLFGAQPAAAARGGGCGGSGGITAVVVKACIHADGATVVTDGYATIKGTVPPGCYITVQLHPPNSGTVIAYRTFSCTGGKKVGPTAGLGSYTTWMCVVYRSGQTCSISPVIHNP